jgi:hypothetical protein
VPPGVGGRRGGRGLNPVRRSPPSPAQAGCAASNVRPGDRAIAWLCSRAVLVAELDERRPVQVFHLRRAASSPRIRLGLAIQPRARVVKGRRKPASWWRHRGSGARLSVIPCLWATRGASQARQGGPAQAEAEETALVERRRPGSSKIVVFDETAAEVEPGGMSRGRRKSVPVRWLRQRTSEARQRSRCAVENAVTGRPSAEELRSKLHQACAGSSSGSPSGLRLRRFARRCRCYAEAGASPSSEALSEELPEVIGRRSLSVT